MVISRWLLLLVTYTCAFVAAAGQQVKLSLVEAFQRVEINLPQLESYRQQALAAKENIDLVKNSLVPDVNAGYQLNLATFNNITGMSYPGLLLPVSGPPSANNNMNFVPGSVVGALAKWNPITFGQRNAAIEKASAIFKQANAVYNEQLFRYQYITLNTYLEAVYIKQVMHSIEAGIARNNTALIQAHVLANTGLKPGIDTTQFQAAIAQGNIDFLQAEKTYLQNITELCNLTGLAQAAENVLLTDTTFSSGVFMIEDTVNAANHPFYETLAAQQAATASALQEVQKSWVPRLDFWGNLYARASGVGANGNINKTDGLKFSRTNAGIGLQLSFPLLQYSTLRIQKKQYVFLLKAGEARLKQAARDIRQQTESALLQYRQDLKIATGTPLLLKSAHDVYSDLSISYEAGLIDYTRLAQAQYDLVKAELGNAGAQLSLWRSLLAVAVAKGNLTIFLSQLK
ncbi:MAG TPA: TolC family protein [Chitinophagaceae bacterium]|nr:TolC family protein [Chitinophagaceae bacterium]